MKIVIAAVLGLLAVGVPTAMVGTWVSAAKTRAEETPASTATEGVEVASAANAEYCTPDLKRILRRVLQSCGLLGEGGVAARGCQPVQARNVATMAGSDFNALFRPMQHHGGIVQFDRDSADLDALDFTLIDRVFADQRGASYFFVVSRASPEGSTEHNRELSQQRADSVMNHLRTRFADPDLDREVGLLWLGEEFAQLDEEFCAWDRSDPENCDEQSLNRSAFIAWIDCTL